MAGPAWKKTYKLTEDSVMLKTMKVVEKKRAYESVVAQIRALIQDGRLKQGDQLPPERELSEVLRVSRATVREAIRTLESLKLVQSRQGEGTYVLDSSAESLIQPLATALFHEKDTLYDIFYVRKIVEPHVAELAAKYASPVEIDELSRLIQDHEKTLASGAVPVLEPNSNFHSLLARMSRNKVLERLLHAISDLIKQTREPLPQDGERAKQSLLGHQEILNAIKDRDHIAARRAMRRHLEDVETIMTGKKKT